MAAVAWGRSDAWQVPRTYNESHAPLGFVVQRTGEARKGAAISCTTNVQGCMA